MLDISYRVRNLIVAGALAICAVSLMLVYVSHSKHSSAATRSDEQILVAARDIPIGTTGAQLAAAGWLRLRSFPADSVPSGAVADKTQLASLVAIQPTYRGEQIVARRFGTSQQEGLLSDLRGRARVMELPGDSHQLLAGTLRQGNRVDVVGNVKVPEGGQTHVTVVALRNLLVVRAPSASSSSNISSDQSESIDLQLTAEQAQRLFWLEKNGDWSLVLRPSIHATDTRVAPASGTEIVEASSGR